MKIKLAATCFIIGTALTPVAAFAADGDSDRSHPVTYVKDSVITVKIKARLADEKMKTLTRIKVDTDAKGVVVLSGRATTQEQADRIVAIARETEGVTSVNSHIRVGKAHAEHHAAYSGKPAARSEMHAANSDSDRKHPMTYVKDSVITAKVKAKLAEDKMGSLAHVSVDTDNKGAVVLRGTARTQEQVDQAVTIARATEGVTSVTSNIQVKKDD